MSTAKPCLGHPWGCRVRSTPLQCAALYRGAAPGCSANRKQFGFDKSLTADQQLLKALLRRGSPGCSPVQHAQASTPKVVAQQLRPSVAAGRGGSWRWRLRRACWWNPRLSPRWRQAGSLGSGCCGGCRVTRLSDRFHLPVRQVKHCAPQRESHSGMHDAKKLRAHPAEYNLSC